MVVLLLSSNLDIRILTLGNLLQYHVQYYYIIIIILSIIESLYYILYIYLNIMSRLRYISLRVTNVLSVFCRPVSVYKDRLQFDSLPRKDFLVL